MDDPKLWIPRKELFSEYQKLKANKLKPSKAEQKQANILHDEELRNLKAARRTAEETNPEPTSKGAKKRIASKEEPRGSEDVDRYDVNHWLIDMLHDQLDLLISYWEVYVQRSTHIGSSVQLWPIRSSGIGW